MLTQFFHLAPFEKFRSRRKEETRTGWRNVRRGHQNASWKLYKLEHSYPFHTIKFISKLISFFYLNLTKFSSSYGGGFPFLLHKIFHERFADNLRYSTYRYCNCSNSQQLPGGAFIPWRCVCLLHLRTCNLIGHDSRAKQLALALFFSRTGTQPAAAACRDCRLQRLISVIGPGTHNQWRCHASWTRRSPTCPCSNTGREGERRCSRSTALRQNAVTVSHAITSAVRPSTA